MEFKNRVSKKFLGLVLLLCISRVCHGHLMCYVCNNCDQITAQTPQFECNEDFFNTSGQTDSSVQTTTEHPKTTAAATENTDTTTTDGTTLTPATNNTEEITMTTTRTTTTETKSPEATTKATTENVTETTTEAITETTTLKVTETTQGSTSTTEEQQQPSSPRVGPSFNAATVVPTPPNSGTLKPLDDVESLNNQTGAHAQHVNKDDVEEVDVEQGNTTKPYKPSAEFRVRQLRSVSDVTYHCFKVQATTVNGTMVVNRGCSRTQTNESVCGQWQSQHSNEKMIKCYPCSRTKCNGSSALNVSIAALIVAVVAVFMHRK